MKSTIKIALGDGNAPIIEFKIANTDDIRDTLCRQFIESLNQHSNLCSIQYQQSYLSKSPAEVATDTWHIRPLGIEELIEARLKIDLLIQEAIKIKSERPLNNSAQ